MGNPIVRPRFAPATTVPAIRYGRPLAVEFVSKLRDTRPFGGPAELVEQLRRDVAAAQRALSPA